MKVIVTTGYQSRIDLFLLYLLASARITPAVYDPRPLQSNYAAIKGVIGLDLLIILTNYCTVTTNSPYTGPDRVMQILLGLLTLIIPFVQRTKTH